MFFGVASTLGTPSGILTDHISRMMVKSLPICLLDFLKIMLSHAHSMIVVIGCVSSNLFSKSMGGCELENCRMNISAKLGNHLFDTVE